MTDPWSGSTTADWGRASGPRAGFWRRLGGWLIDGIIIGFVTEILDVALHRTLGTIVGLLVTIAYYVSFEGGPRGAAFGKQAMGIRVIDAHTGYQIGYPRAFVRWISQIISTLFLFLGYLWMLWDPEKQCWHDKFAGDVVVPTADYPVVAHSASQH
jgi:uncharacterized RDD family membrane protein YckC